MSKLFSRRSKPARSAATPAPQAPAAGAQTMAAQIGNQGMLNMAQTDNSAANGANPDLEQALRARVAPTEATPAPEEDPLDPLGLGQGEDREAWLANIPGAEALYKKLEDQASGKEDGDRMKQLYRQLGHSQKGGLGNENSSKYSAVMRSINRVMSVLDQSLNGNIEKDRETLNHVISCYATLIDDCKAYLSRRAFTGAGKARQAIVTEIMNQAQTDASGINSLGDQLISLPEDKRKGSVRDLLSVARTRTLTLRTGKEADLKHVGGLVSHIAVLDENATTDGASGYFKEDDVYTHTERGLSWADAVDLIQNRSPIDEKLYLMIRACKGSDAAKKIPEIHGNRQVFEFLAAAVSAIKSRETTSSSLDNLNIDLKEGETLNVSKRNVATSRVANLLGIGDVVAQSESAELVDAEGGGRRTGNLMQKARGQEAQSWMIGRMKHEVLRREYNQDLSSGTVQNSDDLASQDHLMTPQFLKSLSSLQVLDNLVGQVDLHIGNYMVDEDRHGRLGKVQGIDNDFAFGNTTLMGNALGRIGQHGRSILNQDGTLGIAHMDKALAERILQIKKPDIELMLADVLEPWAIESFWGRIEEAQRAIREDMENNPDSGRFLTDDEQWDQQALQDFHDSTTANGNATTSYISEFSATVKNSSTINTSYNLRAAMATELNQNEYAYGRAYWHRIRGMDPDSASAYLKQCGLPDYMIKELRISGQLTGEDRDFNGNSQFKKQLQKLLNKHAFKMRQMNSSEN